MLAFQVGLLLFGLVSGFLLARHLPKIRTDQASRVRLLIAFGGGVAAWMAFAAIALSGPMRWTFMGTALAIYLPSLIAIVSSGQPLGANQEP